MASPTKGGDRAKPEWGEQPDDKPEWGKPPPEAAPAAKPAAHLAKPAPQPQPRPPAERPGDARRRGTQGDAPRQPRAKKPPGAAPARSAGSPGPAPVRKQAPAPAGAAPAPGAAKAPAGRAPAKRAAAGAGTKAGPPKKGAAKKAVATKQARPKAKPRRRPAPSRGRIQERYAVVHDTEGPRVRLGVGWFVVALGGLVAGPLPTALVYGAAAAVAAAQTAHTWRKDGAAPAVLMAATGAGLMTVGASFGAGGAGVGMLGAVGLAFLGATGDGTSRNPRIADIGWTLQCALGPGIVGLSMVLLARLDQGSAIALLLLASAYETGDFLIGSGSRNPLEGPAAGAAAVVVVTFIVSTLPISALTFGEAWVFGGLVAAFAPIGQLVASGLLPSATSPASGLRRLDSLLLAAPMWAWGVGLAT